MSDSLKYSASDMSGAGNDIRYQTVCSCDCCQSLIIDDSVCVEASADDVTEDVLNACCSSVNDLLILLFELVWEWDVLMQRNVWCEIQLKQ